MKKEMLDQLLIVVLNYKNYEMTIKCVENIIESTANILIVDNCSPNESYDVLQKRYTHAENVHVVKSDRNGGYAYGNNYGVRWGMEHFTDINYVAIMNPDVTVEENTFATLVAFLEKHNEVIVASPVIIEHGRKTKDSTGWNLWSKKSVILSAGYILGRSIEKTSEGELVLDEGKIIHYVDVVKGCFYVVRAVDFIKLGMLDEETFLYGEEEILAYKVKQQNKKEAVLLQIACQHDHAKLNKKPDLAELQSHLKNTYRSREILLRKYYLASQIEIFFFKLLAWMHINVEYPIVHLLKRFIGALK